MNHQLPLIVICSECGSPMPCSCVRDLGWNPKPKRRWRSKEYLKFIRRLPCAVPDCHGKNIEASHFGPRGMGTKVHDCLAIPLCRYHHRESHCYGKMWEHYVDVMKWQMQTMVAALTSGLRY